MIAWLVTRQVVDPVRVAARTAERFSAGRLEERMKVERRGRPRPLAASFNQMAASLQRQISQLEDLSRVQRRFVSDVSHELRTPLTTVRMAADVLHEARDDFDPAVSRSAELLQDQLDRFESLLTDLLEISRFDAGAAVLEAEAVDVRDVARRVLSRPASRWPSGRGLRWSWPPPTSRASPRSTPAASSGCCATSSRNAIEHGEGRPVEVRVAADAEAVAVGVRDHGVGLRPGEAALVFNRFWRADPARARTTGGTGLGLAIALEDARLHGGWLQAWGQPGDGSHFRVTLPRKARGDLEGSPLPLEPADARSERRVPVAVGVPIRRPETAVSAEPEPGSAALAAEDEPGAVPAEGVVPVTARRGARAALALGCLVAVAALVAGCASIPTASTVRQGDEVLSGGQDDPFIRVLARPPVDGMSQRQIVAGFLEASASFDGDHEVARQYLAPEVREQLGPGQRHGGLRRRRRWSSARTRRRTPSSSGRPRSPGSPTAGSTRRRTGSRWPPTSRCASSTTSGGSPRCRPGCR